VYYVNAKPGHGGCFALGALCLWPVATDPDEGVQVQPVTVKELTPILERAADTSQSTGSLYVLAIAAPAGFDQTAREAIAGSPPTRPFSSPHLAPCLVDLASNTFTFNPDDRRITQFLDLFAGELEEEAIRRVAQHVRQALLTRQSQSVDEVAAATRASLPVVERAFALVEAEGPYVVQRLKGLGQVISRRL
jgi:hypothetical protein